MHVGTRDPVDRVGTSGEGLLQQGYGRANERERDHSWRCGLGQVNSYSTQHVICVSVEQMHSPVLLCQSQHWYTSPVAWMQVYQHCPPLGQPWE